MNNSINKNNKEYWLKKIIPLDRELEEIFIEYINKYGFWLALDKTRNEFLYVMLSAIRRKIDYKKYEKKFNELTKELANRWDHIYYKKKNDIVFLNKFSPEITVYKTLSFILNDKRYEKELNDLKEVADSIKTVLKFLKQEEYVDFLFNLWSNYPKEIPIKENKHEKLIKELMYASFDEIKNSYPNLLFFAFSYFLTPEFYNDIDKFQPPQIHNFLEKYFKQKYPEYSEYSQPTASDIRKEKKQTVLDLYDFFVETKITLSRSIYLPIITILNLYYRGIIRIKPLYPYNTQGKEALKKLIQRG